MTNEPPPVELPDVPPVTTEDWSDAKRALMEHATHKHGCPMKDNPQATCTCSAGRWINAIKV